MIHKFPKRESSPYRKHRGLCIFPSQIHVKQSLAWVCSSRYGHLPSGAISVTQKETRLQGELQGMAWLIDLAKISRKLTLLCGQRAMRTHQNPRLGANTPGAKFLPSYPVHIRELMATAQKQLLKVPRKP